MPRGTTNKRAEVARMLESAILSGLLTPGVRLPEMRLGRELGVSQAIVREALQDLESLGLVVKQPNRGSFVVELTPDDLVHIYQVRRELEPLACGLAAAHRTQQDIAALQTCLTEMRAAAEHRDFSAYSGADVRFHRLIWAAQPNRFLQKSLETVCLPLFAYDQIARSATAAIDYARVTRQHEMVLIALQTGDSALASRLMHRLMPRWLRIHLTDFQRIRQHTAEQPVDPREIYARLRAALHTSPANGNFSPF